MTGAAAQKQTVLARLDRLAASELGARTRVKEGCAQFRAKLTAPVRVGLFGANDVGKRAALNLLAGVDILPLSGMVPTAKVEPGTGLDPVSTAMFFDRQTETRPGYPDEEMLAEAPVFLSIATPDLAADGPHYLVLVCDDTVADFDAGLQWAAGRVDLSLWFCRDWTALEHGAWVAAPDGLRDHAILCVTGGAGGLPKAAPANEFQDALCCDLAGPGARDTLLACVEEAIAEAVLEDVLAAQLFLTRCDPDGTYSAAPSQPSEPEKVAEPKPAAPPETAVRQTAPQAEPEAASPEARADLAKLFRFTRKAATDLRIVAAAPPEDDPFALAAFEQVFETLSDFAAELDTISETWPALETAFNDARDLALLLRLEGGADEAEDAARLLLQLRWDMEATLAA